MKIRRLISLLVLVVLMMVFFSIRASASSFSFGSNLGTLNYSSTTSVMSCKIGNGFGHYSNYSFSNFVYISNQNTSYPITGTTYYISGSPGSQYGNCPNNGPGPTISYSGSGGSGYQILISPTPSSSVQATISVPGYINPKYVVLGVTYVPPGPSSSVDYTSSTLLSNTSSVSSSFSSSFSQSVSVTSGIAGWAGAKQTKSFSTTFAQQTQTSSSVTVSKQTSYSVKTPGPANAYQGVNHDYDVILVWINPVLNFNLSNNNALRWQGYGYSTLDQPGMDIVPVYVGWLNGDFTMPSNVQQSFQRSWAAGEIWPSGQGPGLTATDLQNILAMDPYGQCRFDSAIGSSVCPTPSSTRFTLTNNLPIFYQQPPPGGQPQTTSYQAGYTNMTTQGQGATNTYSTTFGRETAFNGTVFDIGFSATLNQSLTLTWTNTSNSQLTSSSTSTAALSVTGPPCSVSGSSCSPVYPPSSPTYGTGVQFDVYQDNLFGTFLIVPTQY
jgi:hypothetical protein